MARNRTVADYLDAPGDSVAYHYGEWKRLKALQKQAELENDEVCARLVGLHGTDHAEWRKHPEDWKRFLASNRKSDDFLGRACDEMDEVLAGPLTSPEAALAKIECVLSNFPRGGLEPYELGALTVLCQLQSILSAQMPAFDAIEKEAA